MKNFPLVFSFTNYYVYLDAIFQRKKTGTNFTLQMLSDDLALNHKTKALRLIKGEIKNLSLELIDKISDYLNHNSAEREYFRHLVAFNESETIDKKNEFFEKMHTVIQPQMQHQLESEQRKYFSEWQYPVLKEILTSDSAPKTTQDIATLFLDSLSPMQVSKSIDDLVQLGIITKDANMWKAQDINVTLSDQELKPLLLQYHLQNLKILSKRFENKENLEQLFGHSITIGAPADKVPQIKHKLQEHYQELLDLGATFDEGKNSAWQFSMYLYPMTQKM